jgi:Tol biopolymer transport system component
VQALPLAPERVLEFTTEEGSWMAVDVSPDARTLIFDLLGDLYTLPLTGGEASRLTSGMGFNSQPRYSPDGHHIVFISDRGGAENVWIMNADGTGARALTDEQQMNFVSPIWSSDGDYVVVSRAGPRRTYQLWMYHQSGGRGLSLTAGETNRNAMGAAFSPRGDYIYFASRQGAFGFNVGQWQLATYERKNGIITTRTQAYGGAFRPAISPDGKWLAFGSITKQVCAFETFTLARSGGLPTLCSGTTRSPWARVTFFRASRSPRILEALLLRSEAESGGFRSRTAKYHPYRFAQMYERSWDPNCAIRIG